jgi:putative transposase
MPNDSAIPQRRHPVHGIKYVEGQPTIIFDTLCLKKRRSVFACEEFHRTFLEVARTATAWLMGRYVLMPDHIHFFAGDVGAKYRTRTG